MDANTHGIGHHQRYSRSLSLNIGLASDIRPLLPVRRFSRDEPALLVLLGSSWISDHAYAIGGHVATSYGRSRGQARQNEDRAPRGAAVRTSSAMRRHGDLPASVPVPKGMFSPAVWSPVRRWMIIAGTTASHQAYAQKRNPQPMGGDDLEDSLSTRALSLRPVGSALWIQELASKRGLMTSRARSLKRGFYAALRWHRDCGDQR